MKRKNLFRLTFSAIFISLAIVLEIVCKSLPFLKMPNGGGIAITMLPLAFISIICGLGYGVASGIVFGLIDCFLIDGYGFSPYSFIFDYILAYSLLSIISLFRNKIIEGKKSYFIIGFLLGGFLRWLSCGLSGVLNAKLWGYDEVFLEGVFGVGHASKIWLYLYSFVYYNLPVIGLSTIISIIIGLVVAKRIVKMIDPMNL